MNVMEVINIAVPCFVFGFVLAFLIIPLKTIHRNTKKINSLVRDMEDMQEDIEFFKEIQNARIDEFILDEEE